MGRKNTKSWNILNAVDISTNQTSESTNVAGADLCSIHVTWSGSSPSGTIAVEARNSDTDAWRELDFGTTISVSGASGEHEISILEMAFQDLRLKYTASSGTGTMTAVLFRTTKGA